MPKQDFKVTYRNLPEFRYQAISGGFGSATPYGQILFALYHEHLETPEYATITIIEGEQPKESLPASKPVRDVYFGMQLTPEQALAIGNWLIDQANNVLSAKSQPNNITPTFRPN